jgi:hypothetical protein
MLTFVSPQPSYTVFPIGKFGANCLTAHAAAEARNLRIVLFLNRPYIAFFMCASTPAFLFNASGILTKQCVAQVTYWFPRYVTFAPKLPWFSTSFLASLPCIWEYGLRFGEKPYVIAVGSGSYIVLSVGKSPMVTGSPDSAYIACWSRYKSWISPALSIRAPQERGKNSCIAFIAASSRNLFVAITIPKCARTSLMGTRLRGPTIRKNVDRKSCDL